MSQSLTMSPDFVYQMVASNPNLRSIVEQTARLMQVQQQLTPALHQMAANPMAAFNGYVDWQNQQAQQSAQQVQPLQQAQPPQQAQQSTQGGQQVNMVDQAMAIVEEFRKSFEALNNSLITLNNNLKEVYDQGAANAEAIKALGESKGRSGASKAADKEGA